MEIAVDLKLDGKVALITGASRGIGRAIAEHLAAEGAQLCLVARSGVRLAEVCESISLNSKNTPASFATDLQTLGGAIATVDFLKSRYDRLDILINCAGGARAGNFLNLSNDEWLDGFSLKVMAAVRLCQLLWPMLIEAHGTVINFSGGSGRTPRRENMIAGAANAALVNFSKALADQGLLDDVNVNVIQPGPTNTDRLRDVLMDLASAKGLTLEVMEEHARLAYGIRRYGTADEVATLVTFLVSHHARQIHGATVVIDGGSTRGL